MQLATDLAAVRIIARNDGWCDDPGDRNYNRPVSLPYRASHEELWRNDHLYDVVVVLAHNDRPRVSGRRQRHLPPSGRSATAADRRLHRGLGRRHAQGCWRCAGRRTRIKVW